MAVAQKKDSRHPIRKEDMRGLKLFLGISFASLVGIYLVLAFLPIVVLGFILGIYSGYVLRRTLKDMSERNRIFSTPAKILKWVVIGFAIGLVIAIAAMASIFNSANPLHCTRTSTGFSCTGSQSEMMVIALTLLLILAWPFSLSTILGFWRIGALYGRNSIKAGALLYIPPFINLAAPFVILYGLRRIEARIRRA